MILRPPRSTRTDTLFPDTSLFRSTAPSRARFRLSVPIAALAVNDRHHAGPWANSTGRDCIQPAILNDHIAAARLRFDRPRGVLDRVSNYSRSEERRVGKECVSTCRTRRWTYHKKKNIIIKNN